MSHRPWPYFLIPLFLFLFACSSGPTTSTGNQHFTDAKNNIQASDFKAALTNLDATLNSNSDASVRQQAAIIRVALLTALADANQELAEAYHVGAKQPSAQSQIGAFYKTRSDYNNTARSFLMDAMQSVMDQRSKLDPNPVTIEVAYPGFTGGTNQTLVKIKNGQLVSDADRSNAEVQLERNDLARVFAALAGAGEDLNKGRDLFASGKVNVDPRVYIIELSDSFFRIGDMFGPHGLNEPDKLRTVNQVVEGNLDVANKLLAAKPDKDLEAHVKKIQADCDKCLKKLGA